MSRDDYELIDSGDFAKLERFGPYTLARPCAQAVWKKSLSDRVWDDASATFSRTSDAGWQTKGNLKANLPDSWTITTENIALKLSCTDFGHLGIFAEHRPLWHWIRSIIQQAKRPIRLLNLFAYSGGATLAAAQAGADVCHLDASKSMVAWARENATLNKLEQAPIRWIIEDAQKFINREIKRGKTYDAIVLDPPSFGRGANGELFKIEEHINPLLDSIKALLSDTPLFVLFSCHTPGLTPKDLLAKRFGDTIETGALLLEGKNCSSIPSGSYARWIAK